MEGASMDWIEWFVPTGSLLEMLVRGTVMYLALFCFLRFLPRRQIGALAVSDLLVLVLIADAAQNGMAGEYRSITEGLVLVATILLWDFVIDWLDYRFPGLQLNIGKPVMVIHNGRLLKKNLEKQYVSEGELMSQLRLQGVDDLRSIRKAYVEGDGRLSVIRDQPAENSPRGMESERRAL
jgi:uncharacterized membrane protein YcaP (DUF421 family)